MAWRWDIRPLEFRALPPADRKRVWNRCYWRSLRRPRMLAALLALSLLNALTLFGANALIGGWTIGPVAVRTLAHLVIVGALTIAFARYAAHLLRDELRTCATSACLHCFYDLTGNVSGVCPECGTPRRPQQAETTSSAAEASSSCDAPSA